MSDHGHRTFVGTLLFLDVVEPRPDSLGCLQDAAERTVGHLPEDECLRVAHEAGLLLAFTGDPEDALFAALALRDALEHEAACRAHFQARLAAHLGPVRVTDGVATGEGATMAVQIVSATAPGQILASRSFYEVVSSLSVEHRGLLRAVGRRRTRDGRDLDLYELGTPAQRPPETTWPAGRTPAAGVAAMAPIPLVTPVEPPAARPPTPALVTGGWVAGALEELSAELARTIGPLASTLVRRASRTQQDPRALVAELLESIEGEDDRRRFQEFGRGWVRRSRAPGTVQATPLPPHTPAPVRTPVATPPARVASSPAVVAPFPGARLPSAPAAPLASPAGGVGRVPPVSPEQRAALEAALAPHLGPIARLMVDRAMQNAPDWGTACRTLSASIPDEGSREDFLRTLSGPAVRAHTQLSPPRAELPPRPAPPSRPETPRGSPSRPMPVASPTPVTRSLHEEDLLRAEQALSIALGPVARALVRRAAKKASTPQELYASLAAELPEGPERERFLATQPRA